MTLLDVAKVRRNQRSFPSQDVRSIQDLALRFCSDRDNPGTTAFRPGLLDLNAVSLVREAWLELDALFTAQAEFLL